MTRSLLLFLIAVPLVSKAQFIDRFRHSAGASVHFIPSSSAVSVPFGAFYNPQVNILNRFTDFSVAATLPLTLGVHIKSSLVPQTFFYAHVPAVIEANIGHYSNRSSRNDIGMGIGVGYALQATNLGAGSGPVFTVAARSWVFRGSITIRYMFHLNATPGYGYDTHNVTLAINMGRYFSKLRTDNRIEKWQRPR